MTKRLLYPRGDSNPQSSVQETDALSIRPRGHPWLSLNFFPTLSHQVCPRQMAINTRKKPAASPGNRTRVARMGILHDTTTPATLSLTVLNYVPVHTSQARLAQSVEHETLNLRVVGSSPTLGATLFVSYLLPVLIVQGSSQGAMAQLVKAPVQ